jgi:serine beta-lactamase-like protein LACTB, mitochondrial
VKRRTEIWLAVIVVGIGLLPVALGGLWWYMSATATTLHPDPVNVPSATRSAPLPRWADAVERGRRLVRASLTEHNLPGLSVAIGLDGDIVWAEGFGWADLESRVPVTPGTQFKIGTASKALTAAAVGLLVERGRLNLDHEIQTYVPAFPAKEWPVTLRQLMGHLAGVSRDEGDEEPLSVHCKQIVEGLARFADRPLLFEPGTEFRYSSYGWILVSAAAEAAANEPLFVFMRKQIFEPLGMQQTRADSVREEIPDRAVFYFPRFAADPRYGPQPPREDDYSCFAGASAIVSTPSDLVRFGMAINDGKLLQPATVQLLQTSQRLAVGRETGYGLGWDLETVPLAGTPTRWIGHGGELMDGMVASFMTFPEHGIVVSVTSNIAFTDTASIALGIAEVFAEEARRPASK